MKYRTALTVTLLLIAVIVMSGCMRKMRKQRGQARAIDSVLQLQAHNLQQRSLSGETPTPEEYEEVIALYQDLTRALVRISIPRPRYRVSSEEDLVALYDDVKLLDAYQSWSEGGKERFERVIKRNRLLPPEKFDGWWHNYEQTEAN